MSVAAMRWDTVSMNDAGTKTDAIKKAMSAKSAFFSLARGFGLVAVVALYYLLVDGVSITATAFGDLCLYGLAASLSFFAIDLVVSLIRIVGQQKQDRNQ